MNKDELLNLVQKLNFPKDEFYILSGGSLLIRGIREKTNDLDLCISEELFEQIKDKYNLTDDKKNEYGFYKLDDMVEIVVEPKSKFNIEECEPFNLEDLNTILAFKEKVNRPKDQIDIQKIKEYLNK